MIVRLLTLGVAALSLSALAPTALPAREPQGRAQQPKVEYLKLDDELTVRTQIARSPGAQRTVLLLHGFPETLYTWNEVSLALASDHEVHAFDWPGFGRSSRPSAEHFAYSPRDYARVLRQYVDKSGIDRSTLIIYATDIGALPALIAALEEPGIARTIIVGDFAPFNRPQYLHERLERLKSKPSSDLARSQLNASKEDTLENAFKRGLPAGSQFQIPAEFKTDMSEGWDHGPLTSADAFYHYYSHFTRDQDYLEAHLGRLKTPVKVVWGADDIYIRKDMGAELAERLGAHFDLLPGVGHYPHLQAPSQTVAEIRSVRFPSADGDIQP